MFKISKEGITESQSGYDWKGPVCLPGSTPAPAGTSRAGCHAQEVSENL